MLRRHPLTFNDILVHAKNKIAEASHHLLRIIAFVQKLKYSTSVEFVFHLILLHAGIPAVYEFFVRYMCLCVCAGAGANGCNVGRQKVTQLLTK